jgi:DNA-binding PadR family transcriptional regulator
MVSKALIAASTKPMILSILAGGESYGYRIIQSVKRVSGGQLEWSDGMLYPVLHRLEKEGLIDSRWTISERGRRRKYYRITESGREELERDKRQWLSVHEALSKLWKPLPALD